MGASEKTIYTDDLKKLIGKMISEPFLILQMEESDNVENSWQSFVFSDIKGRVNGKAWSENRRPEYAKYVGQVCIVTGRVERFRGVAEIKVNKIVPGENIDFSQYVRALTQEEYKECEVYINRSVASIQSEELRRLIAEVFKEVAQKVKYCPADVWLHHNIIGGLIRHTAEVVRTVDGMVELYGGGSLPVDRDLVVAGAVLHDLGVCSTLICKTFIYEKERRFDMTGTGIESNNLIVKNWYRSFPGEPETFDLTQLCHIVLSARSDGIRPVSKEALIVKKANELSEELAAFDELFYSYDNSRKAEKEGIKEGIRSEYFGRTMYRRVEADK